MLHKAIFLKDAQSAIFLIKNGSDINSLYHFGSDDTNSQEVDYCAPSLHLACGLGLDTVVKCLVENRVDANQKVSSCIDCHFSAHILK